MAEPLIVHHRVGGWLPRDHNVLQDWLNKKVAIVEQDPQTLLPVIQGLKNLIEGDTQIYMLFHQMFEQVPTKPPYNMDPTGTKPQIRDYHVLLQLLNYVMTHAPEYNGSDLVGFPINAVLDWPMGTKSGYAAFLDGRVNKQFREILNYWKTFLGTANSRSVLNKDPITGWFGEQAMASMPDFDKMFVCDPLADYHGFKSWDDFFTRQFRDGIRPVELPDNDRVINNACESAPYNIQIGVKERDRFWIKGQPYSLRDMMANDPETGKFVGGTVYQAFLSAKSYHRWHSPVDGKIVKAYLVPGTYYSEAPSQGMDPSAPNSSQGYITAVASRQVVFIEAANKDIGLMCFIAVGMAEVSSCEVTVEVGKPIKKGQEIGMFHFGGSTHCLIFQKGVNIRWDLKGQVPSLDAKNLNVKSAIGYVEQA